MDCIFCQIVAGKIPGDILYQDEEVIAFPDINPAAPTHVLIVTRKHIPSLTQLTDEETPINWHRNKVSLKAATAW